MSEGIRRETLFPLITFLLPRLVNTKNINRGRVPTSASLERSGTCALALGKSSDLRPCFRNVNFPYFWTMRDNNSRNSDMVLNEVYFWTSTIVNWKNLLKQNKYKEIILGSLKTLIERNCIAIYGYVHGPSYKLSFHCKSVDRFANYDG